MARFDDSLIAHPFRYSAMPLARRREILPDRNVCSLMPGDAPEHAFWTGDGIQRVEIPGDPYDETLVFTQEALYEPKWLRAPEPPDLTGVMPEVRLLLREGRFAEAAERDHPCDAGDQFLGFAAHEEIGFDRAGRDRIDGDAAWA